ERKYALSEPSQGGPQARVSSPWPGRSTLMTSAPRSPRTCPQNGPASTRDASRTRTPCNGNRLSAIGFPVCFGAGERARAPTLPGLLEHFLFPTLCKQARPVLLARHRTVPGLRPGYAANHDPHDHELTTLTSWLVALTRVRIDDSTDLAPLPQGTTHARDHIGNDQGPIPPCACLNREARALPGFPWSLVRDRSRLVARRGDRSAAGPGASRGRPECRELPQAARRQGDRPRETAAGGPRVPAPQRRHASGGAGRAGPWPAPLPAGHSEARRHSRTGALPLATEGTGGRAG